MHEKTALSEFQFSCGFKQENEEWKLLVGGLPRLIDFMLQTVTLKGISNEHQLKDWMEALPYVLDYLVYWNPEGCTNPNFMESETHPKSYPSNLNAAISFCMRAWSRQWVYSLRDPAPGIEEQSLVGPCQCDV